MFQFNFLIHPIFVIFNCSSFAALCQHILQVYLKFKVSIQMVSFSWTHHSLSRTWSKGVLVRNFCLIIIWWYLIKNQFLRVNFENSYLIFARDISQKLNFAIISKRQLPSKFCELLGKFGKIDSRILINLQYAKLKDFFTFKKQLLFETPLNCCCCNL